MYRRLVLGLMGLTLMFPAVSWAQGRDGPAALDVRQDLTATEELKLIDVAQLEVWANEKEEGKLLHSMALQQLAADGAAGAESGSSRPAEAGTREKGSAASPAHLDLNERLKLCVNTDDKPYGLLGRMAASKERGQALVVAEVFPSASAWGSYGSGSIRVDWVALPGGQDDG